MNGGVEGMQVGWRGRSGKAARGGAQAWSSRVVTQVLTLVDGQVARGWVLGLPLGASPFGFLVLNSHLIQCGLPVRLSRALLS